MGNGRRPVFVDGRASVVTGIFSADILEQQRAVWEKRRGTAGVLEGEEGVGESTKKSV